VNHMTTHDMDAATQAAYIYYVIDGKLPQRQY